jgi:hypothetical protein
LSGQQLQLLLDGAGAGLEVPDLETGFGQCEAEWVGKLAVGALEQSPGP